MRRTIGLNGEWDFMPDFAGLPPEEVVRTFQPENRKLSVPSSWRWMIDSGQSFQPYDLFGYPHPWNEAQSGVISRRFDIHREGEERVVLIFRGLLQAWAIYVNGQPAAAGEEGFLPLEVDVTSLVHEGDNNELRIWCGPFSRVETPAGSRQVTPSGSWFGNLARGPWQDVLLEYRPPAALKDVLIRTSHRQNMLSVSVSAGAAPGGALDGCEMTASVLDGDLPVKDLGASRLDGAGEASFEAHWPAARRWSPADPHLYTLQVDLRRSGKVLDSLVTRFGFREVWLDGPNFILNGVRINLRGDAWHYQGFVQQTREYARSWYRACQAAGLNFIRLHAMPYPSFYLDVADEEGMLIVDESAIYGSGKAIQADHPQFIAACRSHLAALVRRDRNHPSVVIWSMQNEMRWVDGRDGYKAAMGSLTRVIKDLDPTRPVSYDGDNRLVDPASQEIISMHYNIDGPVASWGREKPLIFGEHGPYHYVSPQAAAAFGGPEAYGSFERALEAIGLSERLFLEYARREGVTGVTPFNFIYYSTWPMPDEDLSLAWADLAAPGPKPGRIPAHSLSANNGLLPQGYPLVRLNPAATGLEAACKPVTIIPDQLNTAFYGGESVQRSFSIYNDTECPVQATLTYHLRGADGDLLAYGHDHFRQEPGERCTWEEIFFFPEVLEPERVTLWLELEHDDQLISQMELTYRVAPRVWKTEFSGPGVPRRIRVAYAGNERGYAMLSSLVPGIVRLKSITQQSLQKVHFLVLGPGVNGSPDALQPLLDGFVSRGGFLLVLEQERLALGDLTFSGRGFSLAWPSLPEHPILKGLSAEDLRFWGPDNPFAPDPVGLVANAFNRPTTGNFEPLLECGAGDFGWGGLLWTPLLLYHLGAGQAVFSQVELTRWFDTAPAAARLVNNLLEYGFAACDSPGSQNDLLETYLLTETGSPVDDLAEAFGLIFQRVRSLGRLPDRGLVVVDPAAIDSAAAVELHAWVARGGRAVVLPADPDQVPLLELLTGREVDLVEAPVYQLGAVPGPLTRGLAPFDLDWIEKVTYTPPPHANTVIGQYALEIERATPLLQSLDNPWEDFFVHGLDAEYVKMAIAAHHRRQSSLPYTYAAVLNQGDGLLVLIQVRCPPGNDKARRLYTRLLDNLGAQIDTPLLRTRKAESEEGLDGIMALAVEPHLDEAAMLAYFTAPDYLLNNLGEGVFGWMKRIDRTGGALTVPASAGKTWFLTAFIESAANHDPSQRAAGEVPDPSIVPDLSLEINCPFDLYVNGRCFAHTSDAPQGALKIEDVLLRQGAGPDSNRFVLVCRAPAVEDITLKAWFVSKFGEPLAGLRYLLTLD